MHFGIIGTSAVAERFTAAVVECPGNSIEAVYSRSLERAQTFAEQIRAPCAFDTLSKLANCREIDAVYIASPTAFHASHSIQILEAGKHVLCEKPLASNAREAELMFAAARRNGCLLLEAMRPAFMPSTELIISRLATIDPLRQVTLNYCQYSSRYDKFKAGIVENAFRQELSNGALMDIGVYVVQLLVRIIGVPTGLHATDIKLSNGIDGAGSILASYPEMQAQLIYSKISDSHMENQIQGENGCIVFDSVSCPRHIRIFDRSGLVEEVSCDIHAHDMMYEIDSFLKMARDPASAADYNKWTRQTMAVLDEVRSKLQIEFPADLGYKV